MDRLRPIRPEGAARPPRVAELTRGQDEADAVPGPEWRAELARVLVRRGLEPADLVERCSEAAGLWSGEATAPVALLGLVARMLGVCGKERRALFVAAGLPTLGMVLDRHLTLRSRTKSSLSRLTGLSHPTVSAIMNDRCWPQRRTLDAILRALDLEGEQRRLACRLAGWEWFADEDALPERDLIEWAHLAAQNNAQPLLLVDRLGCVLSFNCAFRSALSLPPALEEQIVRDRPNYTVFDLFLHRFYQRRIRNRSEFGRNLAAWWFCLAERYHDHPLRSVVWERLCHRPEFRHRRGAEVLPQLELTVESDEGGATDFLVVFLPFCGKYSLGFLAFFTSPGPGGLPA
ncbi:MAG: helix-turn-helix transcriptional regulator [Thermaerobacter sp.]|nr:helix-turn-helix transcriptional regulator [Thermaerobacter sp.]